MRCQGGIDLLEGDHARIVFGDDLTDAVGPLVAVGADAPMDVVGAKLSMPSPVFSSARPWASGVSDQVSSSALAR